MSMMNWGIFILKVSVFNDLKTCEVINELFQEFEKVFATTKLKLKFYHFYLKPAYSKI